MERTSESESSNMSEEFLFPMELKIWHLYQDVTDILLLSGVNVDEWLFLLLELFYCCIALILYTTVQKFEVEAFHYKFMLTNEVQRKELASSVFQMTQL